MRNFRLDDESGHQEALFSWAAYRTGLMPELQYMYHVPNSATAGILYRRLLRLAASSAADRAVFITFRRAYKRAGNSNHALEATQEREAKNENNKHFELKGRRSQDLYSGKHGV